MFVASCSRTMATARPKIVEPEKWVSIAEIRARKRAEAAEMRRQQEAMTERGQRRRDALDKIETAIAFWRANYVPAKRPVMEIIKEFCQNNSVSVDAITGKCRSHWLIALRFACIRVVADERPDLSMVSIGRAFNRDHTSILHSLRKTRTEGKVR